jgi:hypothetical protein
MAALARRPGRAEVEAVTNREPVLTVLPVGRRIYCRREEKLSDEHILPLSLSGAWILPKASCSHCRNETHAFEGKVAGDAQGFRTRYGLPSRHGHPKTLPIHFAPDGGTTQINTFFHSEPVLLQNDCSAGEPLASLRECSLVLKKLPSTGVALVPPAVRRGLT